MTYLDNVEHDIRKLLATSTTDTLIKYVKGQLMQSYHNGMKAGASAPVGVRKKVAQFFRRPNA